MFNQAWFVAVFTVIPVLAVAGALNRDTLLRASRTKRASRMHKLMVIVGYVGFLTAMTGMSLTAEGTNLATTILGLFSCAGVGGMLGFLWENMRFTLDEEPHPDRLESELRDIRKREAELVRKLANSADDSRTKETGSD